MARFALRLLVPGRLGESGQRCTAEEALAQISAKDYALPFVLDGQQVVRLGINFSRETRNIEKVLVG